MQVVGFSISFASGEISPEAQERTDLQQHAAGCEEALNFIGAVSGPNLSRGGFLHVGAPKTEGTLNRKIPWLRADGEGLVLEFGPLYARVWTARGAKVTAGPQVEFVHPYTADQLAGLRFRQIGDIAIVTHRGGALAPRVVKRISDTSWSVAPYSFVLGPWLPENADDAKTLTLTEGDPGVWAVVASAPLFTSGHVGAMFRVRAPGGQPGRGSWAPNTSFAMDLEVLSDGRVYKQTSATAKSGNTPPIHERGTVSDGALNWQFLHDGAGVIVITAVTDSTNAVATAATTLPLLSGDVTEAWAEGSFSDARGWPSAWAAVREERLALAGTPTATDAIEFSRTAGFTPERADYKPGLGTGLVVDDDAVRVNVGRNRARIVWMVDAAVLVVGTTDAEWVVTGSTVDDPITPTSVKPRPLSGHGSADVEPAVVQGPPSILLHVARGGQTLRELQIGTDQGTNGRDLSLLAQHVFGLGVAEMAWTRPDNNLWLRLDDGTLAVFTYHAEHQVMGVRRQPLPGGWLAESLCASPDPQGRDRLHVGVWRIKDTVLQRAHLVLSHRNDGVFVDIAGRYQGAPATVVSGLSHLNGETVSIVADGARIPDQAVAGGAITLPTAARDVVVGLPMRRRFKSLPLDPQGVGSMLTRKARAIEACVILDCVEADIYVEPQEEPEPRVNFERVTSRRAADLVPVSRRKRHKIAFAQGADRDNRIVVETSAPFDLCIYALRPVFESAS